MIGKRLTVSTQVRSESKAKILWHGFGYPDVQRRPTAPCGSAHARDRPQGTISLRSVGWLVCGRGATQTGKLGRSLGEYLSGLCARNNTSCRRSEYSRMVSTFT